MAEREREVRHFHAFSDVEVAALLAGLRWLQDTITGESPGPDYMSIAAHYGRTITPDEIDALCERINT